MKRRRFLAAAGALVFAGPASAQAMPRIGVLTVGNPEPFFGLLKEGLRTHGHVEGRNIAIEMRTAGDDLSRLPALAAELVRLNVKVIVATPTPAVEATKRATKTIPIVMAPAGDPVGTGLVKSLAQPGVNVTGLSSATGETAGKCIEVIRELMPEARRVGVVANAPDSFTPSFLRHIELAAKRLSIELVVFRVTAEDVEGAFARARQENLPIMIVQPSLPRVRLIEMSMKHRVPSIGVTSTYARSGGLISYSGAILDQNREAAAYVDRLLRGAKAETLPVQQPTRFELIINLKTAKALGVNIPPALAARADLIQ